MHYKRLQKYGKKLAVAVLTSAVLLASGATVYADDTCLLYTSPSPRDGLLSRMPSSA